ncbi:MAG: sulfatase-like hydrolase/transferase, partial [Acidobacteriaceae bacterium]|nr:sulfatase-like hydrolase/transferase [Acidobacteriaceae bacterium]
MRASVAILSLLFPSLLLVAGCAGQNDSTSVETTTAATTPADTTSATAQQTQTSTKKPNIVFILTDDEDYASAQLLPSLKSQLIEKGASFDNDFVGNSLCCPSRSTILTGLYAHNHDVENNNPPKGGYEKF